MPIVDDIHQSVIIYSTVSYFLDRDITNISKQAQTEMGDAVAHAVYVLAQSTTTVNKKGQKLKSSKREMKGHSAQR